MRKNLPLFGLAILTLLMGSCSGKDPSRKETFPVTGEIFVDGQPANMVKVVLHDLGGMDQEQPTVSTAFTDESGKFAISTYEESDGVPAGEYVAVFMWGELNLFSMQYGGPDKLKGKYLDPKTSEHKITVADGEPAEFGRIELTTR